uniref:Uncharacterized protein n=1 Tax=Craspedostauros australis TaxID=1486917 RepID=A0A7R9ZT67_9STRA|mmetsp:Transcript_9259/g.25026  ORF Transcript_9259/g.25026 Transcript_9259/m.25026 type:complete len:319 (+) Transcript_9259:241-1197(+)|eukprot:CAMPEP_0198129996 /NCGR_PEP_ID=MMETSP1442-20131203/52939_1 /TAXON_ID= /ORGANISM="Craspedostauros australis, Strain CCMP3328" /LENGTH=318 /DNA_ID=CAMNT_0043790509 /DNA_START=202 /DNA_END=1158 /DNA_ORIENTATION=+
MKASLVLVLMLPVTEGFLFGTKADSKKFVATPEINKLMTSYQGKKLDIRLVVGDPKDESSPDLALQQFEVELLTADALEYQRQNENASKGSERLASKAGTTTKRGMKSPVVALPGANGPFPRTSSGAKALKVLREPSFVGMDGLQHAHLERGCWELIWRKGDIAGNLICGFQLTEEIQRNENGASLPAGCRIYLSFLMWTDDRLKEHRDVTETAERKANELLQEKLDEVEKMEQSVMPWDKAMHFRRALTAHEKHLLYHDQHKYCLSMTPGDGDLITLQPGLSIMKKGNVWMKDDTSHGDEHKFIGVARVKPSTALAP